MKLLNGIMIFAGGLLIGAVSGYQVAKKKYVAIKEQQIEELLKGGDIREEYLKGPKEEKVENSEESREHGALSAEARSTLKNLKKKSDDESRMDYTKYYESEYEDENDPAEEEFPSEEIAEEHLMRADDPPELIDGDNLGSVPEWVESETLLYYVDEKRLVDEDEVDIENPEYHVGDILKDIDWDNEKSYGGQLFVWNHAFDTLYEIVLM